MMINVETDNVRELPVTIEALQQVARAAAEVEHAGCAADQQIPHHRVQPFFVQSACHRPFECFANHGHIRAVSWGMRMLGGLNGG
jgi:hypothetical protein